MLFIDELTKNDMHDAGEAPLAHAGIPVALVGPGVNEQRLSATNPDGSVHVLGSARWPVPADRAHRRPVAAALAANDLAYGGPATGYAFALGVGEVKTQAVPFDITHTTINVAVTLKGGDYRGMPIPGAAVTLYSDAAGETKVGSGETEVSAGRRLHVDQGRACRHQRQHGPHGRLHGRLLRGSDRRHAGRDVEPAVAGAPGGRARIPLRFSTMPTSST